MDEFDEEIFLPREQRQGMLDELNDILDNLIIEKKILEGRLDLNHKSGEYTGNAQVIDSLFLICIEKKIDLLKNLEMETFEDCEDDIVKITQQYLSLLGKNEILVNFGNLVEYFDELFYKSNINYETIPDYMTEEYYISWRNGCYNMIRNMYFYIKYKLEQYSEEISKCQKDLYDLYYGDTDEPKIK